MNRKEWRPGEKHQQFSAWEAGLEETLGLSQMASLWVSHNMDRPGRFKASPQGGELFAFWHNLKLCTNGLILSLVTWVEKHKWPPPPKKRKIKRDVAILNILWTQNPGLIALQSPHLLSDAQRPTPVSLFHCCYVCPSFFTPTKLHEWQGARGDGRRTTLLFSHWGVVHTPPIRLEPKKSVPSPPRTEEFEDKMKTGGQQRTAQEWLFFGSRYSPGCNTFIVRPTGGGSRGRSPRFPETSVSKK